jgi:hypothetical protein
MNPENSIPPVAEVTSDQVHWRFHELIEVPPVLLISRVEPVTFRMAMARHVDGRHVNDALYRAVQAIRREFSLEPYPYVVGFPGQSAEILIDLRIIADLDDQLAGIVSMPRSLHDLPFDPGVVSPELREHVAGIAREPVIQQLKDLSRSGDDLVLPDSADHDGRYTHCFSRGLYRHSYRYVTVVVPEAGIS